MKGQHPLELKSTRLKDTGLFPQLCLLQWLFFEPRRFVVYKAIVGEDAAQNVGSWLSSIVIWLPLFIIVLGTNLQEMGIIYYPQFGITIILLWLISGRWGRSDNRVVAVSITVISFVVPIILLFSSAVSGIREFSKLIAGVLTISASMSVGVALTIAGAAGVCASLGLAGGTAIMMVYSLIPGDQDVWKPIGLEIIVMIVLTASVRLALRQNIETEATTVLSRFLFLVLTLSYTFLAWIYLLGGWRFLLNS